MARSPMARSRKALAATGLLFASLAAISAHAGLRRTADARTNEARLDVVRLVGTPDLVLSTNARWLRHPSQAEPGAAAADGPLSFDTDPAGALIGPPIPILGAGVRPPRVVDDEVAP